MRNRLEPVAGGTRVLAETDLQITGPQAQFGKGVLEDVGGRILEEFSARLERQISAARSGEGTDAPAPAPARVGGSSDGARAVAGESSPDAASNRPAAGDSDSDLDALDLNKVLSASVRARAAKLLPAVAALVALAAIVLASRRRAR